MYGKRPLPGRLSEVNNELVGGREEGGGGHGTYTSVLLHISHFYVNKSCGELLGSSRPLLKKLAAEIWAMLRRLAFTLERGRDQRRRLELSRKEGHRCIASVSRESRKFLHPPRTA